MRAAFRSVATGLLLVDAFAIGIGEGSSYSLSGARGFHFAGALLADTIYNVQILLVRLLGRYPITISQTDNGQRCPTQLGNPSVAVY